MNWDGKLPRLRSISLISSPKICWSICWARSKTTLKSFELLASLMTVWCINSIHKHATFFIDVISFEVGSLWAEGQSHQRTSFSFDNAILFVRKRLLGVNFLRCLHSGVDEWAIEIYSNFLTIGWDKWGTLRTFAPCGHTLLLTFKVTTLLSHATPSIIVWECVLQFKMHICICAWNSIIRLSNCLSGYCIKT